MMFCGLVRGEPALRAGDDEPHGRAHGGLSQYIILQYVMLYCCISQYRIVYYTMLHYAVLYHYYTIPILYHTILYYTILYYTIQHATSYQRRARRSSFIVLHYSLVQYSIHNLLNLQLTRSTNNSGNIDSGNPNSYNSDNDVDKHNMVYILLR